MSKTEVAPTLVEGTVPWKRHKQALVAHSGGGADGEDQRVTENRYSRLVSTQLSCFVLCFLPELTIFVPVRGSLKYLLYFLILYGKDLHVHNLEDVNNPSESNLPVEKEGSLSETFSS